MRRRNRTTSCPLDILGLDEGVWAPKRKQRTGAKSRPGAKRTTRPRKPRVRKSTAWKPVGTMAASAVEPRPDAINYRYSGHETFPCRYAWLPKAFKEILRDSSALADDEEAMIALGVGKNMVRAIRFWLTTSGLATGKRDGSYTPTTFGRSLMGADPFLEDVRTLWLLHWSISSHEKDPLFAWDFMLSRWPQHEFTRTDALDAFRRDFARQDKQDKRLSDVTLQQHIDVFVHTYVPTRAQKGEVQEDNLDCPLVELDLMRNVGERTATTGREPIYAFQFENKPDITPELFIYFVVDFWRRRHATEQTLSLRELALGVGSPGRLLKLSEPDIKERLARIEMDSRRMLKFRESAAADHLVRASDLRWSLDTVYATEA